VERDNVLDSYLKQQHADRFRPYFGGATSRVTPEINVRWA